MSIRSFLRASRTTAILIATVVSPLAASAQVQAESGAAPSVIRHAYQTAAYSEKFRKHCADLASQYVQAVTTRNKRTGVSRAVEAGRAAENARTTEAARRAYNTRQHSNNLAGTRHAYQT